MEKRQKHSKRFLCIAAVILGALIFFSCSDNGQSEFEKGKRIAGTEPGYDNYLSRFTGRRTDYKTAEKHFLAAAEQGHVEAQFILGKYYFHGCGYDVEDVLHGRIVSVEVVARDPDKAVKWWRAAAEQGHAGAQFGLGMCYEKGNGVACDDGEAIKWYRTASEKGNGMAMFALAKYYRDGIIVEQDLNTARTLYEKAAEQGIRRTRDLPDERKEEDKRMTMTLGASDEPLELLNMIRDLTEKAEQGDASSMARLARYYRFGDGEYPKKDLKEAFKWYLKAAELGNVDAMDAVSDFYRFGDYVEKDLEKAADWYMKYLKEMEKEKKFVYLWMGDHDWFLTLAKRGDSNAMYVLGRYYSSEPHDDMTEAVKWFLQAAEKDHEVAMVELANCYRDGEGVERSLSEAFKWYLKAAEQAVLLYEQWGGVRDFDSIDGMVQLAECYRVGKGVEPDEAEAFKWYLKAAEIEIVRNRSRMFFESSSDVINVMYRLGDCYWSGKSVDQDIAEAVKWYRNAYENGRDFKQKGGEKGRQAQIPVRTDAFIRLGDCYRDGKGVERDVSEAVEWYGRALENGDENARELLKSIASGSDEKAARKAKAVLEKAEKK